LRVGFGWQQQKVAPVSHDHGKETPKGCCGGCRNGGQARPRFIAGVFADREGAQRVAERLRSDAAGTIDVLIGAKGSEPAAAFTGCSRLHQQINRHLASGSVVVVVDAETPEQQLGASRALLESRCDVLLTFDGSRLAHAD
jgi:hypothetical protein